MTNKTVKELVERVLALRSQLVFPLRKTIDEAANTLTQQAVEIEAKNRALHDIMEIDSGDMECSNCHDQAFIVALRIARTALTGGGPTDE